MGRPGRCRVRARAPDNGDATRLRGARVARIGLPQDGYACVDSPDELLVEKLGVEVVRLAAADVKHAYDEVTPSRIDEVLRETRELYDVQLDGDGLTRSIR